MIKKICFAGGGAVNLRVGLPASRMKNQPSSIKHAVAGFTGATQFRTALTRWFRAHGRDLPWRRTRDPYAVLVSETMLQQTQVATVLDYYERWMRRFPDLEALARAGEAQVLHAWQGLGYYSRAHNLHRAAQTLMTEWGGEFPREAGQLRTLPGVGRYTAGALMAFAFDKPAALVDANIARVLARLGNFRERIDSPRGQRFLWETAEALQPVRGGRLFNSALMELGALVCTPRAPRCGACPVRRWCRAVAPESLPARPPRPRQVATVDRCAFIRQGERILLQQETSSKWRGLWRLPILDEPRPEQPPPLLELRYAIMHYAVQLQVYAATGPASGADRRWWPIRDVERAPMPSPHRKALRQLLAARPAHPG